VKVNATLEAAELMLGEIKKAHENRNTMVGFKASGGIRTVDNAAEYLRLAKTMMQPHAKFSWHIAWSPHLSGSHAENNSNAVLNSTHLSDLAFRYPHNSEQSANALQSSQSIDAVGPQVQMKQSAAKPNWRNSRFRRNTDGVLSWMPVKSLTGLLGKDNPQPPQSPVKLSHEKSVIYWNAEQPLVEGVVRESHTSVQSGCDAHNECSQEHQQDGLVSGSTEEWNTDNAWRKELSSGSSQEWNMTDQTEQACEEDVSNQTEQVCEEDFSNEGGDRQWRLRGMINGLRRKRTERGALYSTVLTNSKRCSEIAYKRASNLKSKIVVF